MYFECDVYCYRDIHIDIPRCEGPYCCVWEPLQRESFQQAAYIIDHLLL